MRSLPSSFLPSVVGTKTPPVPFVADAKAPSALLSTHPIGGAARRNTGRFLCVFSVQDAVRDVSRSRAVNRVFLYVFSVQETIRDL